MYVYIYIHGEREREREALLAMFVQQGDGPSPPIRNPPRGGPRGGGAFSYERGIPSSPPLTPHTHAHDARSGLPYASTPCPSNQRLQQCCLEGEGGGLSAHIAPSWVPLSGVRGSRPPSILGCYVTRFAPHLASKSIARGKLTFDERVELHRVEFRGASLIRNTPLPY